MLIDCGDVVSIETTVRPDQKPRLQNKNTHTQKIPMSTKPMLKLAVAVTLLSSAALTAPAQDAGALVDKLVKKGVLSSQEGEEVRLLARGQFAQTRRAGFDGCHIARIAGPLSARKGKSGQESKKGVAREARGACPPV